MERLDHECEKILTSLLFSSFNGCQCCLLHAWRLTHHWLDWHSCSWIKMSWLKTQRFSKTIGASSNKQHLFHVTSTVLEHSSTVSCFNSDRSNKQTPQRKQWWWGVDLTSITRLLLHHLSKHILSISISRSIPVIGWQYEYSRSPGLAKQVNNKFPATAKTVFRCKTGAWSATLFGAIPSSRTLLPWQFANNNQNP